MRVAVECSVCIGSGLCAAALPEVFDQSEEDGTVILLQECPPASLFDAVAAAASACPASAIHYSEE